MPYLNDINNDGMFLIGALFIVVCGVIGPIIVKEQILERYSCTEILFGLK